MVRKIENREIITLGEASEKYNDCRFVFVYTEDIDYGGEESKGYVAYTYDKESEMRQIPKDDIGDKSYGHDWGRNYDPEPYPVIGGIVYGNEGY
ncbi:MAG: hypothetical protein FWB96_07525 [Defluviitaleaceae bacterium]|nr:hypothetical protein [Defluviitaleaceae bacterium]MCL2262775.1 hypothetical protein [Defluviitaleaceae bacterium]